MSSEAPPSVKAILEKLTPFEIDTLVGWAQEKGQNGRRAPRHYFSSQEDALLMELVSRYGTKAWKTIASEMPGRTTRQCRERYQQYLSPQISKRPWTDEEDQTLAAMVTKHGPAWSLISMSFDQRTPVSLKNRWISLIRKGYKTVAHDGEETPMAQFLSLDEEELPLQPCPFDDIEVLVNL